MPASGFRSALGVRGPREAPRSALTDHGATSGLLLDLLMRGGRSWAREKPGRRTWPGPTWRGRGLAALPSAGTAGVRRLAGGAEGTGVCGSRGAGTL